MSTIVASLPSAEAAALAKISSQELSGFLQTKFVIQELAITDTCGVTHNIQVPVAALRVLVNVLAELGDGNAVNLIPVQAELTTQEAAELLNMSRATFVKILDSGLIPFDQTGHRCKVKFVDVRRYKERLEKDRLETLDELSALDQETFSGFE